MLINTFNYKQQCKYFNKCYAVLAIKNLLSWKLCKKVTGMEVWRMVVKGYEDRCNEVVYCPPEGLEEGAVVYFGGDIQDFNENMEVHRDNKNYLKYSLDNMAKLFHNAFRTCHILVIKPTRMDYKTFSCFDNFVPCGNCGVPEHIPMHHSLRHLEMLLNNTSEQLKEKTGLANNLGGLDLKVIGFSKGCIVLNQFLYEFHTLKNSEEKSVITRVKDMYWLDGGHSGGKNTWMTSKELLETLSTIGINIHIHVSPYQIKDDRRPWIKKEEKIFFTTLINLKAPVERHVHSPDLEPNIFLHFKVLDEFCERHSLVNC